MQQFVKLSEMVLTKESFENPFIIEGKVFHVLKTGITDSFNLCNDQELDFKFDETGEVIGGFSIVHYNESWFFVILVLFKIIWQSVSNKRKIDWRDITSEYKQYLRTSSKNRKIFTSMKEFNELLKQNKIYIARKQIN